jgi:two-component system, OmpR family, phosphate regulon sensor histidine kinase PhoR
VDALIAPMNLPLVEDYSMYDAAMAVDGTTPLTISPSTFKSAVSGFIDLLIEQTAPTMLWAKLPKGEGWQHEIERYCKQATNAQALFLFYNYSEDAQGDSFEQAHMPLQLYCPSIGKLALMSEDGEDWLNDSDMTPTVAIPLERNGDLQGEYFVMAVSADYQGLLVTNRNRNRPGGQRDLGRDMGRDMGRDQGRDNSEVLSMTALHDGSADSKVHQLRMLYSCQSSVIQAALLGIQQVVTRVPTNSLRLSLGPMSGNFAQGEQGTVGVESLLMSWDMLFPPLGADRPDQILHSHWTLKQLQRQEELSRRVATYRKQAESSESLQLQQEELMNALRLKDEFLNMVVQELRTPLTNMKTALSLINSPSLKPAQRLRYGQLLHTECERQNSLINGLLNLSMIEQASDAIMMPLRLSDVVPGVVSTYQPLAQEKELMLAYTIPDTLPPIACLTPWLRQVVVNLLHNSIKFTGKGGRVWVRAKSQGDYVQLDVQDTGIGIAPSEIPKVFNRFYRVRSSNGDDSGGAGLGLTIVQQLLLRCGGSITVNSRLGQGSTFTVLLPVHSEVADPVESLHAVG